MSLEIKFLSIVTGENVSGNCSVSELFENQPYDAEARGHLAGYINLNPGVCDDKDLYVTTGIDLLQQIPDSADNAIEYEVTGPTRRKAGVISALRRLVRESKKVDHAAFRLLLAEQWDEEREYRELSH
jgi:hypothetical protein